MLARLVVDEGAAAAIGIHDAAQHDDVALGDDAGLVEETARRVVMWQLELGRDRGLLGAMAHEPAFGAHAQRQAERIEQDRLAGAGFAGEDAKAGAKGEIESLDQHDVADGGRPAASRAMITALEGQPGPSARATG